MVALNSKTIKLRLVEESDAGFILELRLDKRYNSFLSPVDPDINKQKNWIREYKKKENAGIEFYFIIERLDGTPCGTVRVYDLRPESFSWGSWVLNENKTRYAALESAFLVYEFGFSNLGLSLARFDVMKKNEKVVSFHEKMGACKTGEDEKNFYFEMTKGAVQKARESFGGKTK